MGPPPSQGQRGYGPGRVSRPTPDLGPVGGFESLPAPASAPINHYLRVRCLEEDRIAALTGYQSRRFRRYQAIRHLPVVGRIDPVQGRTDAPPKGFELLGRDRRNRLSNHLKMKPAHPGAGQGIGALVALGPISVIVDEEGAFGPTGSSQAARYNR